MGWRARFQIGFGRLLILLGLFGALISFFYSVWAMTAFLGVLTLGVYVLMTGKSKEYDYKRQGGIILYND